MLSRVADAIYWASRYVERAENVARFIDVNLNLMLESSDRNLSDWESLVQVTGDQVWFQQKYGRFTPENVTQFLSFDAEYPNSILSSVARARENLRTVRDIVSREMWQELNELYLMVLEASHGPEDPQPWELIDFYERVKRAGIYFEGVTSATLSHGEAFHFAHLGRMLERADKTSRILDVKYFMLMPSSAAGTTADHLQLVALLNSASALQMFRQLYHVPTPARVAEFLLLNSDFPRTIACSVRRAQESLHAISGRSNSSRRTESERLLGLLRAELDYSEIDQIMKSDLHRYIDALQIKINQVGAAIQNQFFQA